MDALDLTLGWLALLAAALWLASLYVLARTFPLDPCAAPRLTMRHQAALLAVAAWCLLPAPVSLGDTVLRPEAAVLVTVGGTAVLVRVGVAVAPLTMVILQFEYRARFSTRPPAASLMLVLRPWGAGGENCQLICALPVALAQKWMRATRNCPVAGAPKVPEA